MGGCGATSRAGMAGMTLHWDAAPAEITALLRSLSATLKASDFYLAGGTALALLEGHRISVDLDFFSPSFDRPDDLIVMVERQHPTARTTLVAPRTLYLEIDRIVVSFFGYGYPLVGTLLEPETELLPFASREDIAAMKLAAIASRGSRKDFVDLWWLLSKHGPLVESLQFYRTKFATRDVGHVIRSLVYFDDADSEPPLRLLADIDWATVKRDLRTWVASLVDAEDI
jgi:hypothetical protein